MDADFILKYKEAAKKASFQSLYFTIIAYENALSAFKEEYNRRKANEKLEVFQFIDDVIKSD